MRPPRVTFSVRGATALVLVLAVELASLRSMPPLAPSTGWNAVAVNTPVFLLLAASLLAGLGRADTRAWWLGFAAFGWAQLLLGTAFLGYHDDSLMPLIHRGTMALAGWYWDADAAHRFDSLSDIPTNPGYGRLLEVLYLKANAVMSLVVASAGGLLACLLSRWRECGRTGPDGGAE